MTLHANHYLQINRIIQELPDARFSESFCNVANVFLLNSYCVSS